MSDENFTLPKEFEGEGNLYATFYTSKGTIVVELFDKLVPKTVSNFVRLATGSRTWVDPRTKKETTEPLYNNGVFHRVIPQFMIQCGDPLGTGFGGPGYKFPDEFHPELRHNVPGILSMANSGPGTNGSQFFITEIATPWLDKRHSVFGKIVSDTDLQVIKDIAYSPRDSQDRPKTPITLDKVVITRSLTPPV